MLIETEIPARKDGTVALRIAGVEPIIFAADKDGRLVAEIEGDELIDQVLALNGFFPYDEDDFPAALNAINSGSPVVDDDEGGDGLGLDGDDELPAGGAPVEANTPPKQPKAPKQPRTARQAKA